MLSHNSIAFTSDENGERINELPEQPKRLKCWGNPDSGGGAWSDQYFQDMGTHLQASLSQGGAEYSNNHFDVSNVDRILFADSYTFNSSDPDGRPFVDAMTTAYVARATNGMIISWMSYTYMNYLFPDDGTNWMTEINGRLLAATKFYSYNFANYDSDNPSSDHSKKDLEIFYSSKRWFRFR